MRWVIASSVKFRLLVLAVAAALMVVGVTQLPGAPRDVLPEFAPPYVEVQTEALGLSAAEVESLVSLNLEELLNGTPWLDSITSTSVPGLSSVVLTFEPGTDVTRARQLIAERLALAYALPNVSSPPVILQPLSATSRVMMVSLSSQEVSAIDTSVLTRWTVRPALLAVPGVANVTIWGYRDRQLQVQVDPKRLAEDEVSLDQIVRTAGNAMWVSPLTYLEASTPGTGGWIDTPQQRLEVRHVFPISGPDELAKVRVEDHEQRLGNVATVVEGHPPLIGDAVLKDDPGLLLVVEKFPNADTLEVSRGVEKALDDLGTGLAGINVDTQVFRPATYVEKATDNLTQAFAIGGALVLIVLLALLYHWRAALVSAISIAVSLTAAALVIAATDSTFNALVFAGFLIALVVVVDQAIDGVENVMRRVREHRAAGGDKSTPKVVLDALTESNRHALTATLIVILPLLPVIFMTGVDGDLLGPLALSYVLAAGASLVVAVTVTPALCGLLLSGSRVAIRQSPVTARLQRVYSAALEGFLRRSNLGLAVGALAVVAGAIVAPSLGQTTLPEFKNQNLVVKFDGPPGTSASEMTRITSRITDELQFLPGVGNVAGQVGRAVLGDQISDINSSEVYVTIDGDADYDETLQRVRKVVGGYPGLDSPLETYETRSVRRANTGSDDPITVSVFGPRFEVLEPKADDVAKAIADVEGVSSLNLEPPVMQAHVEITVDLARAQRFGLKPGDVRREAATLVAGLEVGSLFEQQKVFQVAVWSEPDTRHSLTDLEGLLINTPAGGQVPLGRVADVRVTPNPAVIRREAVSRRVNIGVRVDGRSADDVAADIKSRLADIAFPLEYHAQVRTGSSDAKDSKILMIGSGIVAAIGIFLLMQAALGSWGLAAIGFFTLPFALVGGVIAAFLADDVVSLASLIGFLAVLAIAARGSLSLISHYRHLERDEGVPFGIELVVRGARERLLPVVLTAVATILAITPLLVTGAVAGQEIAHPIAVIVLGGVVTSAILTLFLVPAFYLRLGPRVRRLEAAE